jgi:hypothetical protein
MKNVQAIIIASVIFFAATTQSNAQGWNQDRMGTYSVGIGGTSVIALGNGPSYITGPGLSVNVSGEYRIQRFVGLGFETGLDVFPNYYYYYNGERNYYSSASIGIPLGLKVNIHILEAANVPIADRLDVYAGLNVGGGPMFFTGARPAPLGPGPFVYGFIQAGPQFGVRYWITHRLGVFGEFGWGATFANVGLSF